MDETGRKFKAAQRHFRGLWGREDAPTAEQIREWWESRDGAEPRARTGATQPAEPAPPKLTRRATIAQANEVESFAAEAVALGFVAEIRAMYRRIAAVLPGLGDNLAEAKRLLTLQGQEATEAAVALVLDERDLVREQAHHATASSSLTKEIVKILREEQAAGRVEVHDESTMPREEFEALLMDRGREMADRDLEILMEVYAERHEGRILFVSRGGHRMELEGGQWNKAKT